ncbi:DUF3310 domain-containing protein [Desulfovibrio sp. OttesenSCG-928-C06]|nr:DUF3310 domain-containing protein [Desulfovibrio sp. OttesenSCG-928-C06]
MSEHNPVSNPAHYTVYPVPPISITRHLGYCLGSAVRCVLSAPHRGTPIEDLNKALRFLKWEIEPLNFAGAEKYGYPFKPCYGAYRQVVDAIAEMDRFMSLPEHGRTYLYPAMFLEALQVYLHGIWREKSDTAHSKALLAFGDMHGAIEKMIREEELFPCEK